jgi:phage gp46-like protein
MTDLSFQWNEAAFRGDWVIGQGGLLLEGGIRSAVAISLFTDARAPDNFVLSDGTNDRRGWWGNTYAAQPWGSLLWTLNRAKKTDGTALLNLVRDMCASALQWLLDGGYVASIAVTPSWLTPQVIGIVITVTAPDGSPTQPFRFDWAWQTNTLLN